MISEIDKELLYCCRIGLSENVVRCLQNGANPNVVDISSAPPAYYSCYFGRLIILQYLLKHGADPNALYPRGRTLLHTVIESKFYFLIPILLQYGADPYIEVRDNFGLKVGSPYELSDKIAKRYIDEFSFEEIKEPDHD